ncbi:MAG: hypothetical protein ACRDN0_40365, partial [Trebonia sp.]
AGAGGAGAGGAEAVAGDTGAKDVAAAGDTGAGGAALEASDAESPAERSPELTRSPRPNPVEAIGQPSAIAASPAVIPAQANGAVAEGISPD